ncbi:Solute carrier family 22 member 2 [Fasciolopsis buskii]|uniref:Solute carrier family 22 member 2 n=1 Tax=Fasciolopsis buskii TaxID=27845 RepID=A0A8E0VEX7_9TREM|nr:Solute carrier family 22 member 2 [Fasciolopsis buski]
MTTHPPLSNPDSEAAASSSNPVQQQDEKNLYLELPSMNVDQILENVVKPCGLWQWSVVLLLACGSCSMVTFPVYANSASAHRCAMEPHIEKYFQNQKHNLTFSQIASLIGPWFEGKHSLKHQQFGCFRYQREWSNWTETDLQNFYHDSMPTVNAIEPCPLGYVFDSDPKKYPGNVVREFETVCHNAWLVPLGTSVFMCGMSLGFMSGGWCGGKFGRRRTVTVCALFEIASAVWTSLSPNYTSYIISRAVMAMFATAKNSVAGILIIELTVARHRSTFKTVQTLGLAFFHRSLLALWAYYIPNWRWLNAVAMGPSVLCLAYMFTLPESPRWLLSQNRKADALQMLKKGYNINHVGKNRQDFYEQVQQQEQQLQQQHPQQLHRSQQQKVLDTEWQTEQSRTDSAVLCEGSKAKVTAPSPRPQTRIRKIKLIRTTLLSVVIMFGVTLSFTGIIFYSRVVRGYVYLTGFLNGLMAIPGTTLFMLMYRYFRRRKYPLLTLCSVSGVILASSGLYTVIFQPENDIVLTIGSNLAFVLILSSLCMGNMYIPELFPSVWRTQGHGTVMGLARIGGILCAFVNELDHVVMHGTPMLLYSVVLLSISIALLYLPDTKGENLPDR